MEDKKILEVRKLAHEINRSINLFEGYTSKKTDNKNGEILFWREIVNIYGIFCDCDRIQIKEKSNLFDMFLNFSLIDMEQRNVAFRLYKDICDLRGWFCHNNNQDMYFAKQRKDAITKIINNAYSLSTNKPDSIENISEKDWNIMIYNIQQRFSEYLDILIEALNNWKNSSNKAEIDQQWYVIFSKALFYDKELINNILAELYKYQLINNGKRIKNIGGGIAYYNRILDEKAYSEGDILDIVKKIDEKSIESNEIIMQSLNRFQLEI